MKLAGLRPLLALLLVATFGLRTVAPELMRGCGPGTGVGHHSGQAAHDGRGHQHTDHRTERCECVGHSCGTTLAVPPPRAAIVATLLAAGALQRPVAARSLRTTPRHVLPFAQGPPASVIA